MALRATICAALLAALPLSALAQEPTLADMRASLSALSAELQSLRAELRAGGAPAYQAAGGDSAIDRMNAIEAELARLTARTEELGSRIDRVVSDGTNRLGDIEFRLCEMDEICDLGALTTPPPLGSQASGLSMPFSDAPPPAAVAPASRGAAEVPDSAATAAERAEFARATELLQSGDPQRAAARFAEFADAHAGGPLAIEAMWLQGTALDSAGDDAGAASAWLRVFASDPNGARAPEALLGLARLAAEAGQNDHACGYLDEVAARFAGSAGAEEAARQRGALSCAAPAATDGG